MRKLAADLINSYFITFSLFLLFGNVLHAQTVDLQVTIKTSHADKLENATIQILALPDTALLQSQASKLPIIHFM